MLRRNRTNIEVLLGTRGHYVGGVLWLKWKPMIDAIRIADVCPERTLVLKEKGKDNYLPIWINPTQAEIRAALLQGLPYKNVILDNFLADNNAGDADVRCATIYHEDNTFYASLLLSRHGRPYGIRCPIGIALALAVRAGAPILVDEAVFDKAGARLV